MDPNDADIAWILRLEAVAPLDSWSWLKQGSVPWNSIDQDMIGMLQELNVMFKIIETEEGWVVPAQEWADACRTAMQKLHRRMKLRSLELAANGPDNSKLQFAPTLEKWTTIQGRNDLSCSLIGHVSGHPILSIRWIRTSRLCGLDPDRRWARTTSRWYRLGRYAEPEHLSRILGPEKGRGILGAALPFHQALLRTEQEQAREGFRDDPA